MGADSQIAAKRFGTDRIQEVESLRAVLAWWVVYSHVVTLSGAQPMLHGPLQLIAQGHYAVDVFVVISGFVIFFLLDRKRERYGPYIGRRFLRLFPMFAAACLLGWLLRPLEAIDLQYWHHVHLPAGVARRQALYDTVDAHLITHLLSHLTLLHGLVPASWAPHPAMAFVAPGWSISLEWQFYLIAPLVLLAFRQGRFVSLALGSAALACIAYILPKGGPGAALPEHREFFVLGMLSYEVYRHVTSREAPADGRLAPFGAWVCVLLASMAAFILGTHVLLPYAIWLAFFALLMTRRLAPESPLTRPFTRVFCSPILGWLGKVSFSTYLIHQPLIYAIHSVAFQHLGIRDSLRLTLFTAIAIAPLTLLISWLTFQTIERPGIRLGRRLFSDREVGASRGGAPRP